MSENFCPVCGSPLDSYYNADGLVGCASNSCWFRCQRKDLPKLCAAVEYTRCQAELARDIAVDEDHAKWLWEEGKRAWARVKEVFVV